VLTILKYVALLVAIVVIRNTNPRARIDHALRFFWGPVTILAVLAVVLALAGR
jgi:NADH-quinone oxidoreductase subunit H